MPGNYIPIFIFAVIVAAAPAAGFAWARRAGRGADGGSPAQSTVAERPSLEETERRSNASQIFLVGALFAVCDVAILFLFAWAARMSVLGAFGLAAIGGFLGILGCGYIWVYRNRPLERL